MIDVKCVKKTLVTQRYSREPLFPSPSSLLERGSAFVQLHGFLIRGPGAEVYSVLRFTSVCISDPFFAGLFCSKMAILSAILLASL